MGLPLLPDCGERSYANILHALAWLPPGTATEAQELRPFMDKLVRLAQEQLTKFSPQVVGGFQGGLGRFLGGLGGAWGS